MKRGTWKRGVVVCLGLLIMAVPGIQAGFNFARPQIMLTDGGNMSYSEISVDFDNDNALHAVWTDDVSGIKQIYGAVAMRDSTVLGKFPALISNPTQNYGLPFIFRNPTDTSKMYAFAINRQVIIPNSQIEGASWDLTMLPATPGVNQLSFAQIVGSGTLSRNLFDMVSVNDLIIFAVTEYPNINLRSYSVSTDTWGASYIVVPDANDELSYPRLAADESGCIYLSYNTYNNVSFDTRLMIRRTAFPDQISVWLPDVLVETAYMTNFRAELAVGGQSLEQKTALVYTVGASPLQIVVDVAPGNTWPVDGTWPGTPAVAATMPGAITMFQGVDIAYAPGGSRLYIVWADDRESSNSEVYGITSYDGGLTFESQETLTDLNMYVTEPPQVVAGTEPGNLAVGFIVSDGNGSNPYVLVSQADYLDTCDNSPDVFWDAYPGVTVDYGTYLSPPACYRLANDKMKGTLLQDYGTIEQTGYISLYFYDDPSITGTNFLVGMENANSKGVIRMLGVRNDTTTSNYSYFNGGWVDSGIPRQTGWHLIVMSVDAASGLTMSLEYAPGSTVSWTDNTFTSFTSVSIQGGSDTDPYYVDDIQLLAVSDMLPVPSTTWFGLVIGLGIIGMFIIVRRR